MTAEKPGNQWPGQDDRTVVKQMLANPDSHHWTECHNFIHKIVQTANLPPYLKEDVVQNIMMSVVTGLPNFHFNSRLTYWLYTIGTNRIIDMARKHLLESQWTVIPATPPDDTENEADIVKVHAPKTTEEECLIHEELHEVGQAILEHLKSRFNPARDRQILKLAWIDRLSHEEIANQIGVSAPVVGYVIRTAQTHLRYKMRHQPPTEDVE